jgi:hypothetical protein
MFCGILVLKTMLPRLKFRNLNALEDPQTYTFKQDITLVDR